MTATTKTMQRNLGHSGLPVSALGLGCWAIGGPWRWLDGQGDYCNIELKGTR